MNYHDSLLNSETLLESSKRMIYFSRHEAALVNADFVYPEHLVLAYEHEQRAAIVRLIGPERSRALREELRNRHAREGTSPGVLELSQGSLGILSTSCHIAKSNDRPVAPIDIMLALLKSDAAAALSLRNYGISESDFQHD
jgi:hypothetical protein